MSDDAFLHEARKADQAQIRDLAAAVERLRESLDQANAIIADQVQAIPEVERLREIIGVLYEQRGKTINPLRTEIRRAFREANNG